MKTSLLLTRHDKIPHGNTSVSDVSIDHFEPAFHIDGSNHLKLKVNIQSDKTIEYLEHAVTKSPVDLRSHVQRIYQQIDRKDREAVFGALLDLFYALKSSGRSLRERMLTASRTILNQEGYQFLMQHLTTGIGENEAVPSSNSSLLSKGHSSGKQLVIKQDDGRATRQDPLDEARDHLEYGQIDEARQVLEEAILKHPNRKDLHQDLLEIYRSTNHKSAFIAMLENLNPVTNPMADAWRELMVLFDEGS